MSSTSASKSVANEDFDRIKARATLDKYETTPTFKPVPGGLLQWQANVILQYIADNIEKNYP